MANIELSYGRSSFTFEYDDARFAVLAPNETESNPLSDNEVSAALDDPVDSPPLEELIAPGDTVLIVASDATRATGSAQIINLLVRRLIQNGVQPGDIAVIFATGIHRAVRPDEKIELLTSFIAQRIRTLDHDACDPSQLIRIGKMEDGTPVEVNSALKEFSKVIVTGAVGFHYFAGFTGGRKSICPGLASARTIEATHMLALDFERGGRRPGVGAGLLDKNAVSEECERVAAMIEPAFSINAIVDEHGHAEKVFVGGWRAAHRRACADYASGHSAKIKEKSTCDLPRKGRAPASISYRMIPSEKMSVRWSIGLALACSGDM